MSETIAETTVEGLARQRFERAQAIDCAGGIEHLLQSVALSRRGFLQQIAAAGVVLGQGLPQGFSADSTPRHVAAEKATADWLATVRPNRPGLHLDAARIESLRAKSDAKHASLVASLFRWVDHNRDWSPLVNNRDTKFSNTVLEEEGAYVTNVALAYVLSGRKDHRELARTRVLAMCEFPRRPSSLYSLGVYLASLARCYDWLHAEFTPAERDTIRTHLSTHVRDMYERSIDGQPKAHWWSPLPLHHDYWIPVGGYGEAALTLLGEVPEAAQWAARAKHLFDVAWSWLGDDGAWHEGVGDWCYAVAPLLMFYGAWRSVTGENLHERPWLRNTASYRLYHWLPNDRYVGLNDSFDDGRYGPTGAASCHLLRRLASLFRDENAQWLAERDEVYDLRPGGKGVQRAPHEKLSYQEELRDDLHADAYCQAWNVLWFDESVQAKPPSKLPLSHHFANEGVVIARSAWGDPKATIASFSCAPLGGQRCAERVRRGHSFRFGNFAHAHADYNAITLFSQGESLVIPAGYARRGSRFQNTVSVNGADFLADPGLAIRIEAFRREPDFVYAVADATEAFPAATNVAGYRRHFWFDNSGRFLVFDDLRLDKDAAYAWSWNLFQWSLHSDPRLHDISADGRTLTWRSHQKQTPRLRVHMLEPDEFAWEQSVLKSLDGVEMLQTHRLVRPEWYSDRMTVLAEFLPGSASSPSTLIRHPKFLAVNPPDDSGGPLIGFALSPLGPAQIADFKIDEETSSDRELLLFGHDPEHPESYLSVRNGDVQ